MNVVKATFKEEVLFPGPRYEPLSSFLIKQGTLVGVLFFSASEAVFFLTCGKQPLTTCE